MDYYRVTLRNSANDALIINAPLDGDLRFDVKVPGPHFIRSLVRSTMEVTFGVIAEDGTIAWEGYSYVSATDLFAVPVSKQRPVRVSSFYNPHDGAEFSIAKMEEL